MATYGQSKSEGVKSMPAHQGGGDSGGGHPPTGSSRSYPKGGSKPGNSQSAPFNPQKVAASKIYVDGV